MFKRIIFIFLIFFILASCADTFDSVKRGLTGSKGDSADEFLVKKKDPLILPPDYENLPTPDERVEAEEENLIFKNTLETETETESSSSDSGSVENSILKKIQSK
tara:strand:+ start:1263 stop:1577 length:315 start_codon:yes stop_codon:yes gene_type:complete